MSEISVSKSKGKCQIGNEFERTRQRDDVINL